MTPRIDWTELFLSSTGRTGRTPFLIAAGVLLVTLVLFQGVVTGTALHFLVGLAAYPLLVFSAACVLSKRLHDRGKSGWWSLVILLAFVMVWPHPEGVIDFLGLIVLVWATVELALMPSEPGWNRYGPNPQRPAA